MVSWNFFLCFMISKMGVKMNFRIITKNDETNSKIISSGKIDSRNKAQKIYGGYFSYVIEDGIFKYFCVWDLGDYESQRERAGSGKETTSKTNTNQTKIFSKTKHKNSSFIKVFDNFEILSPKTNVLLLFLSTFTNECLKIYLK